MEDQEYLTMAQIAERLQVSIQTVYAWVKKGELPAVRLGRALRVREVDLDAMLAGATGSGAQAAVPPASYLEDDGLPSTVGAERP